MKCIVQDCPEESNCTSCCKCQYHHDEEIGNPIDPHQNPVIKKKFNTWDDLDISKVRFVETSEGRFYKNDALHAVRETGGKS